MVPSSFEGGKIPIAKTGYVIPRAKNSSNTYRLEDVIGPHTAFKLELRNWNGKTTMVIVDKKQRIIAVCVGMPKSDETWEGVQHRASEALESARDMLHFNKKDRKHRRGKFPALAVGISHGGGQKYPKVLVQDPRNDEVLEAVVRDGAFERISGFAAGAFAEWAPRLYAYENKYLSDIIAHDQKLRRENNHPRPKERELCRNWPRTPWAAATFNFGQQTICLKHADYNNLAFGWCSITALGDYDHTKGGHLILWDLRLVIEFPPGATVLIPSAAIQHSNVRIRAHERRYSFTQYSAGGIFRYIDNGFKTAADHVEELDADERDAALTELSNQLEFGLSLYSDVPELERTRQASFK